MIIDKIIGYGLFFFLIFGGTIMMIINSIIIKIEKI